jgi:3-hydroxyacyl-CoA dehydrogenase/enoyl-CoA hydratase/3-hydroxybutyryl-CoA epimerase
MVKKLQKKYGAQFKPNKLLIDMAARNERFYDRFKPAEAKKAA